mmetsp:Transcript_30695/g.64330  ORF Transcript_30695/g.64330 Transcript_30695/m.64330 type:complete len:508 (-) Transcript_30695:198-1721(-)
MPRALREKPFGQYSCKNMLSSHKFAVAVALFLPGILICQFFKFTPLTTVISSSKTTVLNKKFSLEVVLENYCNQNYNQTPPSVSAVPGNNRSEDAGTPTTIIMEKSITIRKVFNDRDQIQPRCYGYSLKDVILRCFSNDTIRAAFIQSPQPPSDLPQRTALLVVRDGVLLHNWGVILDAVTGTVYDVSGGCCTANLPHYKPGQQVQLKEEVTKSLSATCPRPVLLLSHSHDTTFYHYVMELLPRLLVSNVTRGMLQSKDIDLFMNGKSQFHDKLLSALLCGRNSTKLTFLKEKDKASLCYGSQRVSMREKIDQFPLVILPPAPEQILEKYSLIGKALREIVGPPCTLKNTITTMLEEKQQTIIVLLREKTRKVANLEKWVTTARQAYPLLNFQIVRESDISSMSLHDTGSLFCSAVGLIGGHGAGLTNMMWMTHKNSTVVEIRRPEQDGDMYGYMAKTFQLRYINTQQFTRSVGIYAHYGDVAFDDANLTAQLKPWFEELTSTELLS